MAIETFKIPTSVTNQPHCLIQFWTTCSSDKLESYVFHQVITKTGEPETTSPTTADCSPEWPWSMQYSLETFFNLLQITFTFPYITHKNNRKDFIHCLAELQNHWLHYSPLLSFLDTVKEFPWIITSAKTMPFLQKFSMLWKPHELRKN